MAEKKEKKHRAVARQSRHVLTYSPCLDLQRAPSRMFSGKTWRVDPTMYVENTDVLCVLCVVCCVWGGRGEMVLLASGGLPAMSAAV